MEIDTRDMKILRERVTRIVDDIWEDASGWVYGNLPHHDKDYYKSEFLRVCIRSGLAFVEENAELPEIEMNKPYYSYQAKIIGEGWKKVTGKIVV